MFILVWGVIWLIIAFCFFAAGVLVGLAAFKVRNKTMLLFLLISFPHLL